MEPKGKKQKLSKPSDETESPSLSKKDLKEAMKKQYHVSMFLARKVISAEATNSNFVFSPTSIKTILTMEVATSENESLKSFILSLLKSSSIDELKALYREMATVALVHGSENEGGPKISSVNGVWMEQSLEVNPSLKDLFENFFMASFSLVDFKSNAEEVRMEANKWASDHTNGLIKDILLPGSVDSLTESIYGNALYFKGVWEDKFSKTLTRNQDFHLLYGNSVSVPFMRKGNVRQYVTVYNGFKVLGLPFRQGGDVNRRFSMYFYLPDEKDGLNNLMKRMASTPGFLDSHIPTRRDLVGKLRIPKFKIEFGFLSSKAFHELDHALVPFVHRACVEIDEDGAEAAAVTMRGGLGGRGPIVITKIDFVADHPFLFLVREDITGTILFVGQIFDPSKI